MIKEIDYEKRVKYAAKALDKFYPGWAKYINRDTLSMLDHKRCVLGQLYGDAYPVTDRLFAKYEMEFACTNTSWLVEINKRLK